MSLAFKKLRVYARLSLMGAVALLVILVLIRNRNHQVTVWFFYEFQEINVVWLLVVTALASILGAWIIRGFFGVMGEVSRIKREQELARTTRQHEELARNLSEQEKRIDAKIKASLTGDDE